MDDGLAVEDEEREGDLGSEHQDLVDAEFFAGDHELLDHLCQTTTFSILHDDVYVLLLNEALVEANDRRPINYPQELHLRQGHLLVPLSQVLHVDSLQRKLLSSSLASNKIYLSSRTLTQKP